MRREYQNCRVDEEIIWMINTAFSVTLGLFPFIVFGPAFPFLNICCVCLYWVVRGNEHVGFSGDVSELYTGVASFEPRSRHQLSSPFFFCSFPPRRCEDSFLRLWRPRLSMFFLIHYLLPFDVNLNQGKATPLQAWTGHEGSRRLRLPNVKTVGTWRW